MGCIVYHQHVADEHLWPRPWRPAQRWEHGQGPLCLRCGLPRGTEQWEAASDRHKARTGHGLGTGACVDACDPEMDKPWWDIEPEGVES